MCFYIEKMSNVGEKEKKGNTHVTNKKNVQNTM